MLYNYLKRPHAFEAQAHLVLAAPVYSHWDKALHDLLEQQEAYGALSLQTM